SAHFAKADESDFHDGTPSPALFRIVCGVPWTRSFAPQFFRELLADDATADGVMRAGALCIFGDDLASLSGTGQRAVSSLSFVERAIQIAAPESSAGLRSTTADSFKKLIRHVSKQAIGEQSNQSHGTPPQKAALPPHKLILNREIARASGRNRMLL